MGKMIEGFFIKKRKVRLNKKWKWYLPTKLEDKVNKGDVVGIKLQSGIAPALVVDILDWDKNMYQKVEKIIYKNRQKLSDEKEKNVTEVKKKSKISEEEREIIRVKRAEGKKLKELAEMYSCSISLIHKIINEKQGGINE